MATINREQHQTVSLPPRNVPSVIAAANSFGSIVRSADQPDDSKQGSTAIAAGETKLFGPFVATAWFDVVVPPAP
jgi:hypothetical protein